MTTNFSSRAKGFCLGFGCLLSASFLFSACSQNHERIEEREQRDNAAKAADSNHASPQDTITLK